MEMKHQLDEARYEAE